MIIQPLRASAVRLRHARQLLCFFLVECNDKLKSAQQKVEQLIEENGELRMEQFEVGEKAAREMK